MLNSPLTPGVGKPWFRLTGPVRLMKGFLFVAKIFQFSLRLRQQLLNVVKQYGDEFVAIVDQCITQISQDSASFLFLMSILQSYKQRTYKTDYYPTALRRVQITPKTSTNITRYLYSRGPARQVFSQRASNELDRSYEKNFCLSKRISFLPIFLTEISN